MDIDKLTDAELNARFDKAFSSVHAAPKVQDVYTPSFRQRWAEATVIHQLAAILIVGSVLPWTILIGGIICLALWDAVTR